MPDTPWPTEIRLSKDRRVLAVAWETGAEDLLAAEYLRVWSPSAEVQGHSPTERKIIPGKRAVEILSIDQVGNYAVRLKFDDLHTTGLFTWDWLWKLAREEQALFGGYLAELDANGLSRDRRA